MRRKIYNVCFVLERILYCKRTTKEKLYLLNMERKASGNVRRKEPLEEYVKQQPKKYQEQYYIEERKHQSISNLK